MFPIFQFLRDRWYIVLLIVFLIVISAGLVLGIIFAVIVIPKWIKKETKEETKEEEAKKEETKEEETKEETEEGTEEEKEEETKEETKKGKFLGDHYILSDENAEQCYRMFISYLMEGRATPIEKCNNKDIYSTADAIRKLITSIMHIDRSKNPDLWMIKINELELKFDSFYYKKENKRLYPEINGIYYAIDECKNNNSDKYIYLEAKDINDLIKSYKDEENVRIDYNKRYLEGHIFIKDYLYPPDENLSIEPANF